MDNTGIRLDLPKKKGEHSVEQNLRRDKMATLHLMVGLPGSGKTTEAKRLEQIYHALRFTPDEWQYFLFGHDMSEPEHDQRHTRIEELMWETAKQALTLNIDVVLDFGCWSKSEREEFRRKAHAFGANYRLHFMDAPLEVLWERLEKRNQSAGKNAVFFVTREQLLEWSRLFEPPGTEELEELSAVVSHCANSENLEEFQ